jgi:hypothetical protein
MSLAKQIKPISYLKASTAEAMKYTVDLTRSAEADLMQEGYVSFTSAAPNRSDVVAIA